jgi:hypothetical protein
MAYFDILLQLLSLYATYIQTPKRILKRLAASVFILLIKSHRHVTMDILSTYLVLSQSWLMASEEGSL